MKTIVLTEESYEIIVSTLINSKIEAEESNKNSINSGYIEKVRKALEELKQSKCEATHLRLTIAEKQKYDLLKREVRCKSSCMYNSKNERTEKEFNDAVAKLMDFERTYGIKE